MNDTPPEARRVAAVLRRDAQLDPDARARLLALALAAASAPAARAVAPSPPAVARGPSTGLALGLSAALLVGGAAWMQTRRDAPAPAAHSTPRPSPVAVAPVAVAPVVVAPAVSPLVDEARPTPPLPHVAAPVRRAVRPHPPVAAPVAAPNVVAVAAPAPPPRSPTLEEELRVVRAARTANDQGHASAALAALGAAPTLRILWEEGTAERVVALCAMGRREEAATLGAAVLRRSPAGASAARVRRSCATRP